MFNKLLKNKPKPDSPDQVYLQGRATADLDAWKRSIPLGPSRLIDCGEREDPCPYHFGDDMVKVRRVAWLTGFYDEIVDETELRVRHRLGLPEINWTPPPETKKVHPPKG